MITLIAAMDPNHVIGTSDNNIPWHIPEDFQHFKRTTLGHPIIMGRKTWESLPKRPLPNRLNIVISSNPVIDAHICFTSIQDAIDHARALDEDVFVIGGQSIYEASIHLADRLLISKLYKEYEGSAFFPQFGDEWETISCIPFTEFDLLDIRRKKC